MRRALVLASLAACRFGFDERNSPGGDAGDAPGADAPADAQVATACGTTALLADTFQGATANPQWFTYANGGITTAQTSGELVITLPATTPAANNYGGYDSSWRYDFRGSRFYVEVTQVTSAATDAQTDMQMIAPNGDQLEIVVEAGTLNATVFVGATQTDLATLPYNATQHRWWQLREQAGTVYFETSPDGVTFTAFATTPTPAWAPYAEAAIEAGSFQSEVNAGAAHFDNVNGGTPSGRWCAASTLRDDFNSGTLDDRWSGSYTAGGCTTSESGGSIAFTMASNMNEGCGLTSAGGFDLTGDAVFAALVTRPANDINVYTVLRAAAQNGDNVEVALVGASLVCAQNVGASYTQLCTTPYDPVAHKFWQLAESGGMLSWQVSPDGSTWSTIHSQSSPIPLAGVDLGVGAGTTAAVASPGAAAFSTFSQLPP